MAVGATRHHHAGPDPVSIVTHFDEVTTTKAPSHDAWVGGSRRLGGSGGGWDTPTSSSSPGSVIRGSLSVDFSDTGETSNGSDGHSTGMIP